ncbi:MAG: beta-ketoacyl-ACP reductase [Phycisphaerae bacterium]|nr:MAG: 3-oxoacyl-[acyl-carrier-protein] reductase [Planctomycetia bacterium]RIK70634.1 MAG: 3-oxoacyl-[acyl-carrier-protein] reductase [Planctomycetota bacterium]GJQ26317.1 MAG: beta-ketoacyl-ACP reductase [Phycisphaerae bacterium]
MGVLDGKLSVVTGGSRGIGRAIALALAQEGSDVALIYAHKREPAQEVADLIAKMGRKANVYKADVSLPEEDDRVVAEIKKDLGTVQILVNNAGITRDKSFLKMNRDMWHEVLNVNLTGAAMMMHRLLPGMIESGWGRIVNITSVVGQMGNFGQANYAAAKGGLVSLTKTLAREFARKNITVNAVAPGYIETDMTANVPGDVLEHVRQMTPMGRLGKPEEVASAVVYLASPQASFITGEVLGVNGGMYM